MCADLGVELKRAVGLLDEALDVGEIDPRGAVRGYARRGENRVERVGLG